jgi:ATP-dependent Clp protease adaptor protein ClpS
MLKKMSFTNNAQLSEMSKKQSVNKRGQWEVILLNDTHNTFEHVITCLMDICGHNYLQAGQCANIVHTVGQCSVYVDCFDEVSDVRQELYEQGLNVTMQKHKKHEMG